MLGHSALRVPVMGLERNLHDRATEDELREMRSQAEQALDAGCIGISIDMVHWHRMANLLLSRSCEYH